MRVVASTCIALVVGSGCGGSTSTSPNADASAHPELADAGSTVPDGGTQDADSSLPDGGTGDAVDAGTAPRTLEDVSPILADISAAENAVALGGAVVDRDGLLAVGAAGLRSRTATVPVTVDDRWHLGSDTKSMTAMLAAILVERGLMTWSTRLDQAFPSFADEMAPGYRAMTLVELLAHRAGVPGEIPADLWAELRASEEPLEAQRRSFARALLARAPAAPPGTAYIYSNAGYMVAGAMLEAAGGRPWEALMAEELFGPLGMDGCGFGPAATPGRLDAPLGHRDTDPPEPVPPGPAADNPPALGPAGTVHCPLAGWARYVAAHLRRGRGEGAILPPSAFERLHADPGVGAPPTGFDYGYGWVIVDRSWAGGLTLTHAGSNTLNFAVAWLAPLRGRGYLAVANQGPDDAALAADRVVEALLRRYPPP